MRTLIGFGESRLRRHIRKAGIRAVVVVGVNILVQCLIMSFALQSLADGKNAMSPFWAGNAEVFGLVAVFVATGLNSDVLMNLTKYRDHEEKNRTQKADSYVHEEPDD
jgi:hypothetical protein